MLGAHEKTPPPCEGWGLREITYTLCLRLGWFSRGRLEGYVASSYCQCVNIQSGSTDNHNVSSTNGTVHAV